MELAHEHGLRDDTVVCFLADHGECLSNHGPWGKGPYHYDDVIRIPFLMSWQGVRADHTTIDRPVELVDLAPTILGIAGLPLPQGHVPPRPEAPGDPPPISGRRLR